MTKQQSDQTQIALIRKDVEYIKKSQDRMEVTLAGLSGLYVPMNLYESRHTEVEGMALRNRDDITALKKTIYMATGALVVIAFVAPYILQVLGIIK